MFLYTDFDQNLLNERVAQFREALLHKDLKCKAPLIESNLRRNLGMRSA